MPSVAYVGLDVGQLEVSVYFLLADGSVTSYRANLLLDITPQN